MPVALETLENVGSPVETWTSAGLTATRTFTVPWNDRYYYCGQLRNLLGAERYYPYRPGWGCVCQSVQVNPLGRGWPSATSGLLDYDKAELIAYYSVPALSDPQPDPIAPQQMISETFEPTVEFLTLDATNLRWAVLGGDPAEGATLGAAEAPGVQLHGCVYTLRRYGLTQLHPDMDALVGTINAVPLQSRQVYSGGSRRTWAAHTVLYSGCVVERSVMDDGTTTLQVDLRFVWRQCPSWNKFPRPAAYAGTWDSLWQDIYRVSPGGSSSLFKPYTAANWANLLPA